MTVEEEDLGTAFTSFVRSMEEGAGVAESVVAGMTRKLRLEVVRELKQRSLWTGPPSFVGVYGTSEWQATLPTGSGSLAPPLDELVHSVFTFVFCDRLPRLLFHVDEGREIDGLVISYLRGFISRLQRRHDPLGYRAYQVLRSAVRQAVDAEELYVRSGSPKVTNSTVLAITLKPDGEESAPQDLLAAHARAWNSELLPELVTAGEAGTELVVADLRQRLFGLESDGVRAFRFGDLLAPMKQDLRARWSALLEPSPDASAVEVNEQGVRRIYETVQPSLWVHEIDGFQKLVDCVSGLVQRRPAAVRTQRYLGQLWRFLRRFAVDPNLETLPSHRQLSVLLRVPRERLPGLYDTLGEMLRSCEERLAPSRDEEEPTTSAGGRRG
ncbi:MAG: hypothetical protein AAGD06_27805 [Acidobacteriota bacterium]